MQTLAVPTKASPTDSSEESPLGPLLPTVQAGANSMYDSADQEFELDVKDDVTVTSGGLYVRNFPLPPLPQKLSPSQAARFSEILDLLHRGLSRATEGIEANDDGTVVNLTYADWQKVLGVQMLLALYLRAVTDSEALNQ
jgi:hypothetical protein